MINKYIKNIDEIFTEDLQYILLNKNISVVGCGGQGGYILEYIARLGVKSISFWDGDIYEESNLNRQIGCTQNTLGLNKAKVLEKRISEINPNIKLYCYDWYFGDNISDIQNISNSDIIFLAFDYFYNITKIRPIFRQLLLMGIPLIDCPVNLLGGYVSIQTKKDIDYFDQQTQLLFQINSMDQSKIYISQPAYKCAILAGEAVNQMVQYFNHCPHANVSSILKIDLYHHKYTQEDKYGEF